MLASNGTGTGWLETLDVAQLTGQDYIEFNDFRIGIRKRLARQHTTFADNTVGGIHKPGGCSIMDFVDTTADISATDGTYYGKNLVYCQTKNSFYCFTADGTTSAAAYKLSMSPYSICRGGDFTWSGGQEFDGSVKFDGTATFADGAEFSGQIKVDGTVNFNDLVDFSIVNFDASINIKGQAEFTAYALFDDSVSILGELACGSSVSVVKNVNITGDFSGTGTARDRIASAWARVVAATGVKLDSYNVANADWSATGVYCISFITNMADANYAPFVQLTDSTLTTNAGVSLCISMKASGFRFLHKDLGTDGAIDASSYSVMVFGG